MANKGYWFETVINKTNQQYADQGIALIKKRPTPTVRRGTKLYFDEHKSTVDYEGVWNGRSIQFEAKANGDPDQNRLSLSLIKPHQHDHLIDASFHGAVCFLIVFMACNNKIYVYPLERLKQAYRAAEEGGRKSIPLAEFEEHGYEVKAGRVPVDYLQAVDAMLVKYA